MAGASAGNPRRPSHARGRASIRAGIRYSRQAATVTISTPASLSGPDVVTSRQLPADGPQSSGPGLARSQPVSKPRQAADKTHGSQVASPEVEGDSTLVVPMVKRGDGS